ncbi:unnamed protein product [Coffea canephora]|uniref:Uncharacterized protein n=1 Tax=Coffea canephora TaxID=49390 RepID=A0A068V574_COFCA|nr:unnamed protein product [Coffea canephora]
MYPSEKFNYSNFSPKYEFIMLQGPTTNFQTYSSFLASANKLIRDSTSLLCNMIFPEMLKLFSNLKILKKTTIPAKQKQLSLPTETQ